MELPAGWYHVLPDALTKQVGPVRFTIVWGAGGAIMKMDLFLPHGAGVRQMSGVVVSGASTLEHAARVVEERDMCGYFMAAWGAQQLKEMG